MKKVWGLFKQQAGAYCLLMLASVCQVAVQAHSLDRPRGEDRRLTHGRGDPHDGTIQGRRLSPDPFGPSESAYRGHDQAREAVSRGEAIPLEEVVKRLRPQYAGRVLRVEFFHDPHFQVWVYDIRMLLEDRALLRLKVNALDADVLRVRGPRKPRKEP